MLTADPTSRTAAVTGRAGFGCGWPHRLVGVDDGADQPVADDVGGGQLGEVHVLDAVEDVLDHAQARGGAARQVDLGDVTGDDHLGAEARAG